MKKTAHFVMLVGISGSGKTSWLKEHPEFKVVCPDLIREELTGNISDQTISRAAWYIAFSRVRESLLDGERVALDATNVNTFERRQFLSALPECYREAILFHVEIQESIRRINQDIIARCNRVDVPEEIIYRQYGDFLYTLRVIRSEKFDRITEIL